MWETVIGLEVHVQLATRSKLFCGCATTFGDAPNGNVCPVCLGLPGALPVPNGEAIRLGTRAALALGCQVHERSVFARKNYFYPDLPKGYQISQFDRPLATGGRVGCLSPERGAVDIGITRLHLEEDAGKLIHDRFPDQTAIDLNRAGVPLAEIVSEPDLRSAAEARAYLNALKQLLIYAEVSECNMEQGTLRVDANVSLRPAGSTPFGTKTEIKNLNSFANVERAISAEVVRQRALLEAGQAVHQVTLLFDAGSGQVRPMRSKEASHDYRYFPDPDLPPVRLDRNWITAEAASLPELPAARKARFQSGFGLSDYDAGVLTAERPLADYFEAVVGAGAPPKAAANWVHGEVLARFRGAGVLEVESGELAALIGLVSAGTVSLAAARTVFAAMGPDRRDPAAIAATLGLVQVRDHSALTEWVDEVLRAHPDEVGRYRGGEAKLLGFLVGQVMKKSRGSADPKVIPTLINERLSSR
ncbi:MAG: Asp-tRNA(Asn)/Glu-tRNA(Gln) amidotransferase subunit GatB [Gemmatimonadales bacterium]